MHSTPTRLGMSPHGYSPAIPALWFRLTCWIGHRGTLVTPLTFSQSRGGSLPKRLRTCRDLPSAELSALENPIASSLTDNTSEMYRGGPLPSFHTSVMVTGELTLSQKHQRKPPGI